ncbi:MAG TPA: tripartite tricarboxylate transporter substrate-binding protein, partial [Ramlibacter sp.]|nr:tripartite tricarboxylate transporter substrate-binding protein [Ramlibacter sp.]
MKRRHLLLTAASLAATTANAQAPWPTRPVTIVVPFAPGGAGNGSVRILAEVISPQIGQNIVVDNHPGAGGITGTQTVTSSSDDHTLLMGSTTMTILPALRSDLPYDVMRDLQPIGMISSQP